MTTPPLVIPVFIPHGGCPHQCLFCNQNLITSQSQDQSLTPEMSQLPTAGDLDMIISQYLGFKKQRSRVELAFFGGNFLGLGVDEITRLLEDIRPYREKGVIDSLRCSTRPDTITKEMLTLVKSYGMELVELGVQSMDNEVLNLTGRGHTRNDTLRAAELLYDANVAMGVQVMAGLPGDTLEKSLETVRELSGLRPVLARIYPVLVLAGSGLAKWYEKGKYTPLSLEAAVDQAKEMVKIFESSGVPVGRLGLQASEAMADESQMLAGPWHPAFGHLVRSALILDQVLIKLDALPAHAKEKSRNLIIRVHPRSESRLRGDKNSNIKALKHLYPDFTLSIEFDESLPPDQVEIRSE